MRTNLDEKLSWRDHEEKRVKKVMKVFWRCRSAIGKHYDLKPLILHCILYSKTNSMLRKHIVVSLREDRRAVIRLPSIAALYPYKVSAKSVLRCKENLKALPEKNLVFLEWVLGRSNIDSNKRADELARKGSEAGAVGLVSMIGLHAGTSECAAVIGH